MAKVIKIWDAPVRFFHWSLVALLAFCYFTGSAGGFWLEWHMRSGLVIIVLLVFRVFWGIAGSSNARFSNFLRGPSSVFGYLKNLFSENKARPYAGHNPAGGWMVLLLLLLTGVQAISGLFVDDNISTQGPLAEQFSGEVVAAMSKIHDFNINVLLGAIGVHISAALFYLVVKSDNIIGPLISGKKRLHADIADIDIALPVHRSSLLAVVFLCLSAGSVYWLLGM